MAIQTAIEWAQASWNPWRGCTKVSPGCQKCYMFREQRRYGRDPEAVVRTTPTTFNAPLRWWKAWQRGERDPRKALPPGAGIFACSWSDWLHADADPWRAEAYEIIKATPYVYMILTKRPERIADCLPADWGSGWPNVWLGVSAERQHEADQRIPILLTVPTVVRWVSAEPLLGPIDLREYIQLTPTNEFKYGAEDDQRRAWGYDGYSGGFVGPGRGDPIYDPRPGLHWVITGGESDPRHPRPLDLAWARSIRDQCQAAGVRYFHKQHGGTQKIDGAWGGRLLDGRTWDEFPAEAAKAVADRFDLLELQ